MSAQLVYTTDPNTMTVVIDYDASLRLFLTRRERLSFSAGKILQMLDYRAGQASVRRTRAGLRIAVGEARCHLTQRATYALAALYRQSLEWQAEFPLLSGLFACATREEGAT